MCIAYTKFTIIVREHRSTRPIGPISHLGDQINICTVIWLNMIIMSFREGMAVLTQLRVYIHNMFSKHVCSCQIFSYASGMRFE